MLAQTKIERDEVGGLAFDTTEEGRLITGFRYREALSFKPFAQNGTEPGFIFDDKNMDWGVCAAAYHLCDRNSSYQH